MGHTINTRIEPKALLQIIFSFALLCKEKPVEKWTNTRFQFYFK